MTIQTKILEALQSTNRLCDDCLSEVAGVRPRQSINIACRALHASKSLLRPKEGCTRCGKTKIVNCLRQSIPPKTSHAASAAQEVVRPASPPIETKDKTDNTKPSRVAWTAAKQACFLVSCVSQKRNSGTKARDLYTSDWFKKARHFVEESGRPWFILSAEHGLLDPNSIVAPYERTLNGMSVAGRREWAMRVIAQMKDQLPPCDELVVLAGARYREFLMDYLRSRANVTIPLEGLRIGEQLAWLASHAQSRA